MTERPATHIVRQMLRESVKELGSDVAPAEAGDARLDSAPRYEIDRAVEMLRVAANYIRKWAPSDLIFYDETGCDGMCVADDCEAIAADLEHNIPPLLADGAPTRQDETPDDATRPQGAKG